MTKVFVNKTFHSGDKIVFKSGSVGLIMKDFNEYGDIVLFEYSHMNLEDVDWNNVSYVSRIAIPSDTISDPGIHILGLTVYDFAPTKMIWKNKSRSKYKSF